MLQFFPHFVECLSGNSTHGLPSFIRDHNVLPYQDIIPLGAQAEPAFILYAVYEATKDLMASLSEEELRALARLCEEE